jgi:hypothetical protein
MRTRKETKRVKYLLHWVALGAFISKARHHVEEVNW